MEKHVLMIPNGKMQGQHHTPVAIVLIIISNFNNNTLFVNNRISKFHVTINIQF